MPLFEYKCEICKNIFEELIFTKNDEKELCCPKCKSKDVHKLISLFGVAGTEKKVSAGSCSHCSTKNCSTCK